MSILARTSLAILVFCVFARPALGEAVHPWRELTAPVANQILSILEVGSRLYVGTDDKGIFVSSDHGQSWTAINGGLTRFKVPLLAGNGHFVLAFVEGLGIYRLQMDGTSWQRVNTGLPNPYINDLAVTSAGAFVSFESPGGTTTSPIYIYRSTDGGSSWAPATSSAGPLLPPIHANAIEFFCFAASRTKLLKTSDGGQTWQAYSLPQLPNYPWTLVAIGDAVVCGVQEGIIRTSLSNPQGWTVVKLPLGHFYVTRLIDHNGAFVASDEIVKYSSTDGGRTWLSAGLFESDIMTLASTSAGVVASGYQSGLFVNENPLASAAAVSAASYKTSGAPGGITALFGQGLAGSTVSASSIPLPTTLANAVVTITDSSGTGRIAPLFFVSPNQINFYVAAETALGDAIVEVTALGTVISSGFLNIQDVAPGIFSANSDGTGAPSAYVLQIAPSGLRTMFPLYQFDQTQGRFVTSTVRLSPQTSSFYLILFGTGWRGRTFLSNVSVSPYYWTGLQKPIVVFAGPSPDFIGLDQMNLTLPKNLNGNYSLSLLVDGRGSNAVTVSFSQ